MSEQLLHGARVLVTGSSGFIGRHLMQALTASGAQAAGLDRAGDATFLGDAGDARFVTAALADMRPTHIIHLAGVLGQVHADPAVQYGPHLLGAVHVLEAMRTLRLQARVLVASSSAVYGATRPEENPLSETHPLHPVTHYAVSKIAQEMAAVRAHAADGCWTVRVRTFNVVGPGQPLGLLASDVARQIAQAEQEGRPATVRVGALDSKRDYLDVRDAAQAYLLLAAHAPAGSVYNVCSGRSTSVQECLDMLTRFSAVPVRIEEDTSRRRARDLLDQRGSAEELWRLTGWQPAIPLEMSLRDLLDAWRQQLGQEVRA